MDEFLIELQKQQEKVDTIVQKIENGEPYIEDIKKYLPELNRIITTLFEGMQNSLINIDLNQNFILQVLNDILYGIEHEDSVFLADVLRYGLIEIYNYVGVELQREDYNE